MCQSFHMEFSFGEQLYIDAKKSGFNYDKLQGTRIYVNQLPEYATENKACEPRRVLICMPKIIEIHTQDFAQHTSDG